jgi:hypothetical protein
MIVLQRQLYGLVKSDAAGRRRFCFLRGECRSANEQQGSSK